MLLGPPHACWYESGSIPEFGGESLSSFTFALHGCKRRSSWATFICFQEECRCYFCSDGVVQSTKEKDQSGVQIKCDPPQVCTVICRSRPGQPVWVQDDSQKNEKQTPKENDISLYSTLTDSARQKPVESRTGATNEPGRNLDVRHS